MHASAPMSSEAIQTKDDAMTQGSANGNVISLYPIKEAITFQPADILYAIGWASVAPGIDGWRVVVADDAHPALVAVIPPGSDQPAFFITRKGEKAIVRRQSR